MANIASAKKAARQAVKRRAHNGAQRSELRTAIKDVRKAIAAGDKAAARAVFQQSVSKIDSIAETKTIFNQCALSAAITVIHSSNLRESNVRFINN